MACQILVLYGNEVAPERMLLGSPERSALRDRVTELWDRVGGAMSHIAYEAAVSSRSSEADFEE